MEFGGQYSRPKLRKSCGVEVALRFSRSLEGTVSLLLCCQMWGGEEDASTLWLPSCHRGKLLGERLASDELGHRAALCEV